MSIATAVMNMKSRPRGAAEPHGEEAKDHKVEIRDRREVRRTRERRTGGPQ